ncbi:hypothetical protein DFQ15_11015 [Xylophilus ampelinus]|uniref:Uncharacterized protein n=1 Tax=Xylophilus ampelinus TaxID=54067 RepID=A0A318SL82_9BURK|nr:hypothetical protein DFQ15_11015 [Xylophilus ampelinus]
MALEIERKFLGDGDARCAAPGTGLVGAGRALKQPDSAGGRGLSGRQNRWFKVSSTRRPSPTNHWVVV